MNYTFHSQDQTFFMHCSFSDSEHNSIKSGKMETESESAPEHSKAFFFVNIKGISIKKVNLSIKEYRHILKGQLKNEKLLKKLLWNSNEALFWNQIWNIHKI